MSPNVSKIFAGVSKKWPKVFFPGWPTVVKISTSNFKFQRLEEGLDHMPLLPTPHGSSMESFALYYILTIVLCLNISDERDEPPTLRFDWCSCIESL